MKHKAQLSIARPSCSDGRKFISILVRDVDAGIEFLKLEVPLEGFSECITGLSMTKCDMEFRGLENVGKVTERGSLYVELPNNCGYEERRVIAHTLAVDTAPEGWSVSNYFGSKDSFVERDGVAFAVANISRWVDKVGETKNGD